MNFKKLKSATQQMMNRFTKVGNKKNNMKSATLSQTKEIIQDNLDYTLFSWSKQKGTTHLQLNELKAFICMITMAIKLLILVVD